jgi:MFS family permease
MPMMLAGRGIAGIGAAGFLAVVRIILADSSSLDENNFQTSVLIILYAAAFSAGPWIGGALVAINFRWVFAIKSVFFFFTLSYLFRVLTRLQFQFTQQRGRNDHNIRHPT